MKVVVVIPALEEEATIGEVVRAIRAQGLDEVVVVDGGSRDRTAERAEEAGGRVVVEEARGYGAACMAGVEEARRLGAEAVAFIDGAGAEDPADLPGLLAPLREGRAELVLGSRVLGVREEGALRRRQRAGNWLATSLITLRFGHRYSDLGSLRAIRLEALERLRMRERLHGWPVEMQVAALREGLRVEELPIRYRRRRGGSSKVSSSLRGSLRAGAAILRVVLS
ncbi:MAG TPA: glycosyltransferase family 2 protein [Myxococcota bacterium]|nr:glycosyltransferase family 2 protein [Myxococcota bacterium]